VRAVPETPVMNARAVIDADYPARVERVKLSGA
jgi:hypothetical protein